MEFSHPPMLYERSVIVKFDSPEQWKWSSFRWYMSGEPGPVRLNDTEILVMKIRPPAA
jgi:hypothetical protein